MQTEKSSIGKTRSNGGNALIHFCHWADPQLAFQILLTAKSVCFFVGSARSSSSVSRPAILYTGGEENADQIIRRHGRPPISISIAEDGRNGPVRFLGVIPNAPEEIAKMAAKRLSRHGELDFCYEAGGCGYGIYRQLTTLGHQCMVVATSMIPRKPGERIKTDRRDSQKLAILH